MMQEDEDHLSVDSKEGIETDSRWDFVCVCLCVFAFAFLYLCLCQYLCVCVKDRDESRIKGTEDHF
jgi:hypothetical protein